MNGNELHAQYRVQFAKREGYWTGSYLHTRLGIKSPGGVLPGNGECLDSSLMLRFLQWRLFIQEWMPGCKESAPAHPHRTNVKAVAFRLLKVEQVKHHTSSISIPCSDIIKCFLMRYA